MAQQLGVNNMRQGFKEYSKSVTVAGFGKTSSGQRQTAQGLDAGAYSVTLQYVDIPLKSDCYEKYLKRGGLRIKPEYQICAGKRGQDSCQADSGGPLLVK